MPNLVPASLRLTVPESSASRTIPPATSTIKSPEDNAIVVPSMLKLSMSMPASAVILPPAAIVPVATAPVVVIVEEPVSILPNPDVIVPEFEVQAQQASYLARGTNL